MLLKGRVVIGGGGGERKAVNYREMQQVAGDYPNLLPAKQLGRQTMPQNSRCTFFAASRQDGGLRSSRQLAAGAAEVRHTLQTCAAQPPMPRTRRASLYQRLPREKSVLWCCSHRRKKNHIKSRLGREEMKGSGYEHSIIFSRRV